MKWLISTAAVMLGLPLLTVRFASHDAGMITCFLLFFVVNPIYSILVGVFAGKNMKGRWFQPFFTSLAFLAGTWLFFDEGASAFLGYAAAYLALGLTVMVFSFLFAKLQKWR